MSTKRQRKDKAKAKQRSMRESHELGGKEAERQTEGLDEAIRRKSSDSDAAQAKKAVEQALTAAESGVEIDPRLVQLFKDFKRYRITIIAIVAVGFGILLASMGLYRAEAIDEDAQFSLIIFANIVIVVAMVIAFGRVRPIREDINAWNAVNEIALRESHGAHGATQADIDKIFLSRARNKRVPPTPEFKAIRRVWYALVIAGSLLIIVSVFLARQNMGDVTAPVVILIVSFAMLLVATFIERTRMKPLREKWVLEIDAKVKRASKEKRR